MTCDECGEEIGDVTFHDDGKRLCFKCGYNRCPEFFKD